MEPRWGKIGNMAQASLVKSGWGFLKGSYGAIVAAVAAVSDPLKWPQAFGFMTDQHWLIEPWLRQGIFAGIAFLWMFIWYHSQRSAWEAGRPKNADMPLHEALRYLATHSAWAARYDRSDDQWCTEVGNELLSKLRQGRLLAWGRYRAPGKSADGVEDLIALDFLKEAQGNWHLLVRDEPPTHLYRQGVHGGGAWQKVRLCREEVEAVWPRRSLLQQVARNSPVERLAGGGFAFPGSGYRAIWVKQDNWYRDFIREPAW